MEGYTCRPMLGVRILSYPHHCVNAIYASNHAFSLSVLLLLGVLNGISDPYFAANFVNQI